MKKPSITVTIPVIPLVVVLAILKLTNVIHISWTWVWSPLWLPILIFGGLVSAFLLLAFVIALLQSKPRRGRW